MHGYVTSADGIGGSALTVERRDAKLELLTVVKLALQHDARLYAAEVELGQEAQHAQAAPDSIEF
jgi:hypothetical protein